MAISGLIITFNEEKMIGKCIDALFRVCDEVIIVDSLSKDRTVEIAKAKGAIVIEQPFLGDGPQRSHGLPFCKNDWILNLDADEFLDADAEDYILKEKYEGLGSGFANFLIYERGQLIFRRAYLWPARMQFEVRSAGIN